MPLIDTKESWFVDLGKDLLNDAKVSEKAEDFYRNTVGFLHSKKVLDETAEKVLPKRFMDSVESFKSKDPSLLIQMPLDGSDSEKMDLDAVYEAASATLPVFKKITRRIVIDAGMDPDETVSFSADLIEGEKTMTHLMVAPLKGRGRALEKIRSDYGGMNARIIDIVRCSIIVDTEDELFKVASGLQAGNFQNDDDTEDLKFTISRCKNRFKDPLFNGYRDALYTVRIPVPGTPGVSHCCEIQIHLTEVVAHKKKSHVFYEYFRSYFSGNVSAADERMVVLEQVVGGDPCESLAETIEFSIGKENSIQLNALVDLFGEDHMTEYILASRVAHQLVELALLRSEEDPETTLSLLVKLGHLLQLAYKHEHSDTVLSKTRSVCGDILGENHRITLRAAEIHAVLMAENERYDESTSLHRATLEARDRTFGPEDKDTLSSCQVLAIVLDKPGQYEEPKHFFSRAYEGRSKILGPDHRDTLDSANGLAVLEMMNGNYDAAESVFRATMKTQKEKYGLDHAQTKWTASNLAGLLMMTGRDQEAAKITKEMDLGY